MRKSILGVIAFLTVFKLQIFAQTYTIPINDFKQQFSNFDSSNLKEVTTRGPMGDVVRYKTYPIEVIKCLDKEGNPVELKNSPSIEIRFTDINDKKTTFYFDLIRVDQMSVSGVQSRHMTWMQKTVPLNTLKKIEVQDGRKNYRYVK